MLGILKLDRTEVVLEGKSAAGLSSRKDFIAEAKVNRPDLVGRLASVGHFTSLVVSPNGKFVYAAGNPTKDRPGYSFGKIYYWKRDAVTGDLSSRAMQFMLPENEQNASIDASATVKWCDVTQIVISQDGKSLYARCAILQQGWAKNYLPSIVYFDVDSETGVLTNQRMYAAPFSDSMCCNNYWQDQMVLSPSGNALYLSTTSMDWDGGRPDPTITDCTPVLPPAILIMQRNLGTGDLTNPTFKEIASGIPSGTLGCTTGIAMSPLGNTLFVGAWVFLDSAQSTCCPEKLLVSFDVVQSTQDGQLLLENQRSVTELQMMTERFPSLSWRDDLGNVSLPSNDGTNSMATCRAGTPDSINVFCASQKTLRIVGYGGFAVECETNESSTHPFLSPSSARSRGTGTGGATDSSIDDINTDHTLEIVLGCVVFVMFCICILLVFVYFQRKNNHKQMEPPPLPPRPPSVELGGLKRTQDEAEQQHVINPLDNIPASTAITSTVEVPG